MSNLIPLHHFDGGIHPAENKTQSSETPIRALPLPAELVLPLSQHIGTPARPLVAVGTRVLKGQKIAEAEGVVSLPLHAPTSGTVLAIEERVVAHASGLAEPCIVLQPDGEDRWIAHSGLCQQLQVAAVEDLPPLLLTEHIRNCGIAGMGGAGFPTAVKLAPRKPVHTLILNGAECEPYITADDRLMRERAADVIDGARIMLHILSTGTALIGVEDNKPQAIAALQQAITEQGQGHRIRVVTIPTKYPSGGEKQLIKILTGDEVPAGGIPADLGLVCQNVGTAAAVSRAVRQGEPLISRITTVTGAAITQPGNYEVLIGTPAQHLLQQAGYQPQAHERVILGGPMMGFALPALQAPLTKTSNCLLAPTVQELPPNDAAMACIRCGLCVQACPAGLLPQQLYWFSKAQEHDKAELHNIFDCIECGACSYVCPSHIPLVQYYRHSKGAIREERAAQAKAERARQRFEERQARQEREAAEKEAKRKARAEAAAQAQSARPAASPEAPAAVADLDKLQKQLEATQSAIAKTKEKLEAARADDHQTDKIPLLEAALVKTQDKLKELAKQIAAAKKAAKAAPVSHAEAPLTATDKGDPNSPERLQRKWETAQARLDTAQQRLEQARAEGLDTVAVLEDGIAKQQQRVDEAKAAYEAALNGTPVTAPALSAAEQAEAVAALEKKILAQQDRVSKMQERCDMATAEGLDTAAALAQGVQKQQDKLQQLQQELAALTTAGSGD